MNEMQNNLKQIHTHWVGLASQKGEKTGCYICRNSLIHNPERLFFKCMKELRQVFGPAVKMSTSQYRGTWVWYQLQLLTPVQCQCRGWAGKNWVSVIHMGDVAELCHLQAFGTWIRNQELSSVFLFLSAFKFLKKLRHTNDRMRSNIHWSCRLMWGLCITRLLKRGEQRKKKKKNRELLESHQISVQLAPSSSACRTGSAPFLWLGGPRLWSVGTAVL